MNNKKDWIMPNNIVIKDICKNSCCLKTDWCDSYKEYFSLNNVPQEVCKDKNPLLRFND